jgi:hypothetical protein
VDKVQAFFEFAHLWLDKNLFSGAAFAVLIIVTFLAVFLLRKAFPRAWEYTVGIIPMLSVDVAPVMVVLSKLLQALPGAVFAAVLGAFATGGKDAAKAAALSAVAGFVASALHEILKAVPWIPYRGTVGTAKRNSVKPPPMAMLLICLSLVSCGAGLAAVVAAVSSAAGEAAQVIDIVQTAEEQWFQLHPNAAQQAQVEKDIQDCRLTLAAALAAADGSKDVSEGQADAAFDQFRIAYQNLEALLKDVGVLSAGRLGSPSSGAVPPEFPRPRILTHHLGARQ